VRRGRPEARLVGLLLVEPADRRPGADMERPRPVVLRRIVFEPPVLGAALLFLVIPDRLDLYGLRT